MNSILEISNLSKKIKNKIIYNDVNFNIEENEIFGLIGLNGAGKTSIIKSILNLTQADEGEISFFNESNKALNARKNIAFLPEKFQPSFFLTAKEFLKISLSMHKIKFNEHHAKNFFKAMNLSENVMDQKIGKFSKGMGQKLGLIATFMTEAPLLILDEPMSGLDPDARMRLKKLMQNYKKQSKAIFFTSHILSDIAELCDRIAIIDEGKIIKISTPNKIIENSNANSLEAAFLEQIEATIS